MSQAPPTADSAATAAPEVYRLLVDDRAWSRERYAQWLKDILIDQLLARPATGPR